MRCKGFSHAEFFILMTSFFLFVLSLAISFTGFDYDARQSNTKSNLAAARSAIGLYGSRHRFFPKPESSGGSIATSQGAHTLEAILLDIRGHGDGNEYLRGRIEGEQISTNIRGNNYVCIIGSLEEYYRDQSSLKNCLGRTEFEKPMHSGGYLYYPDKGLLRLNFRVLGEDLRTTDQLPIEELAPDWTDWAKEKKDLERDWPVRW